MWRAACAAALWCALAVAAAAYTVDCNHEYTDCDTELGKITEDEDQASTLPPRIPKIKEEIAQEVTSTSSTTTTAVTPTRSTTIAQELTNETKIEIITTTEANEITESIARPKPRLLKLNVDDLQNFAIALHNQTKGTKKVLEDLSDVNLDNEDEDESSRLLGKESKSKQIPDKFYSNLQVPFHPLMTVDKSEEIETCKESGIVYKLGERIDRGCDETCECSPGGAFECSPRCKQPFIRRGRRVDDPLCFESPVDECCSIIACATGNGDTKPTTLEVCRYGNDTYPVGGKWNIGCEQTCTCEQHSVVTCKPRCKRILPSDKCINVQDPHDECCEMQICDVSQDVHEEPTDNITSSTSTTTDMPKDIEDLINFPQSTFRPLILAEPIGSIKVLQNNSVQVNLMHMNNSRDPIHLMLSSDGGKTYSDIELKYSNLILNLQGGKDYILKTKETGTKFNFTITSSDVGNEVPVEEATNETKNGCYHDGQFYAIGDEFQIGCAELCECIGPNSKECAPLICPSHVGLELISKGCVRWAPNPPPTPPNCCPRTARCLSDGTCHYKGVPIPNWSEVPLELTGCEQHCFCENGELDCQEACNPLPPLPPQTLRCPPKHRLAPVNISDDDCCKQWGCLPQAGYMNASTFQSYGMPSYKQTVVTPVKPALESIANSFLHTPHTTIGTTDSYSHYKSKFMKTSLSKLFKIPNPSFNETLKLSSDESSKYSFGNNITVFTPEDIEYPFKTINAEPPMVTNNIDWNRPSLSKGTILSNHIKNSKGSSLSTDIQNRKHFNIITPTVDVIKSNHQNINDSPVKQSYDTPLLTKIPLSQINNINYFRPVYDKQPSQQLTFQLGEKKSNVLQDKHFFQPAMHTNTNGSFASSVPLKLPLSLDDHSKNSPGLNNLPGKHLNINKNKDPTRPIEINHSSSMRENNPDPHILIKEPNPYETVLYKFPSIPSNSDHKTQLQSVSIKEILKTPSKTYSSIDLEHLLNQMEVESEVNRNTGRSADKSRTIAAGQTPPGFPANIPPPNQASPFIPTVPPDDRYPQEDISDFEQNNIHRPVEPTLAGLPPGLPIPSYGEENKKLSVLALQSDSPTSIKMLFGLPRVLVGLRGSVDLRYTDSSEEDISLWNSQVFAPTDEVLTTPRLEFRLTGLHPSTNYKIRGKLYLHNLPVEPESDIFSVRTEDLPTERPAEEKRREINGKLTIVDVNDTTAHVSWRHFTEEELQFIDGIQIRYRPTGTPIYSMTELLHHSRSTAELHDLRPGSKYEASLVLIPPPRAVTELYDPGTVEFETAPYIDPYNWSVTVEVGVVGSEAVELTWRGIPVPPERWVRVYRAAHACGGERERKEHDAFRLAARDSPPSITLTGLEANAKCRVWLELFLTNGKVKTSNVIEIHTKPLDSSDPIDNVIEASSIAGSRGPPRGDYYGALVVVGVVAALAALTAVLLLLVVVRRHRPRSVPITSVPTAPRESSLPPYDNPAYKLELQQETMDL